MKKQHAGPKLLGSLSPKPGTPIPKDHQVHEGPIMQSLDLLVLGRVAVPNEAGSRHVLV